VRPPHEGEKYFALVKIEAINFESPEETRNKILFDNLTAAVRAGAGEDGDGPRAHLGPCDGPADAVGKGQRGLIVGSAAYRKDDAAAVDREQHYDEPPEVVLIVLLIDERPEEVTDMQRSVKGE